MATDISEGEKDEWGESNGGDQEGGVFSFPPERAEGIGEGAKDGAHEDGGPRGEEQVFHLSRIRKSW